jgi:hypothetical protein
MTAPVTIRRRANVSRPWLPAYSKAGAVLIGPDGEIVRVLEDGLVERVRQAGEPGGGVAELDLGRAP